MTEQTNRSLTIRPVYNKFKTGSERHHWNNVQVLEQLDYLLFYFYNFNNMIKLNGKELNAFVDFGNGFKFIIESVETVKVECYGESVLFKVNPKSLDWVRIEEMLKSK